MKFNLVKKGFTLIELTVSMGLLALVVSLTIGVLISVVRSYQSQRVIGEIERNGDFVMRTFEESLRGAQSISCVDFNGASITPVDGATTCTLGNNMLLHVNYGLNGERFFGRGVNTTATCPVGASANCFVYTVADRTTITGGNLPTSPDPAITNASAVNGVNVTRLNAVIRGDAVSGQPYNVTVTMDVSGPLNTAWATERRTFLSFLTLRGTYK